MENTKIVIAVGAFFVTSKTKAMETSLLVPQAPFSFGGRQIVVNIDLILLVISFLMLATTRVWASKMRSFSEEIVAKFTATFPAKNSLMASSLGDVPGGLMAKASCARDLTLLSMIASTSSALKPALVLGA